uniref:FH2 domain-containing protein n=1 Tax=Steinernema glaseri TaxID=37863 RepID=A0A1I7YMX0_9BILA
MIEFTIVHYFTKFNTGDPEILRSEKERLRNILRKLPKESMMSVGSRHYNRPNTLDNHRTSSSLKKHSTAGGTSRGVTSNGLVRFEGRILRMAPLGPTGRRQVLYEAAEVGVHPKAPTDPSAVTTSQRPPLLHAGLPEGLHRLARLPLDDRPRPHDGPVRLVRELDERHRPDQPHRAPDHLRRGGHHLLQLLREPTVRPGQVGLGLLRVSASCVRCVGAVAGGAFPSAYENNIGDDE